MKYQIPTDDDFTYKPSVLYEHEQNDFNQPSTKRRKILNIEVCQIVLFFFFSDKTFNLSIQQKRIN